ncbi:MAG TPA: histidine kinase [Casimicrobiaceae bacterium]|nr:histidine kinase [Casimicrobiaceae bacterium]
MEPRWLAPVTWRLVTLAVLVAVAASAGWMIGVLQVTQGPWAIRWWPAMAFLRSYVIAALTIVFVGAFLMSLSDARGWRPLALAIAVVTGCLVCGALLVLDESGYVRISYHAWLLFHASFAFPVFALAAAAWYFADRGARRLATLRREEAARDGLVTRMVEARLSMLEAQVEPHFIFNTLANIRGLARAEPARARRMAERFATYLRGSLQQMRGPAATLGQEVDLACAYLDVQQVRMGRRLSWVVDVPATLRTHPYPPMMLISLVENAIKHGLNPAIDGGMIRISARAGERGLTMSVADTGGGLTRAKGSGVGLSNIRARLTAMHGGAARLTLAANVPHGMVATIEVPLTMSARAAFAPAAALAS